MAVAWDSPAIGTPHSHQGTGWTQSYGEAKAAAHSQGLRFLPALPRLQEMPHPAAQP